MDGKVGVFNPLATTFTVNYDILGLRQPQTFTVPARDIAYFAPKVAEHIKKHLATAILNKRGIKNNAELDLSEIMKEISL